MTRRAAPLDAHRLVARLAEMGVAVDDADELMAGLERGSTSADSGQILVGSKLVEGCTFTHRLSVTEVVNEWVLVHPDLSALAAFTDRFATANSRGELQVVRGAAVARLGLGPTAAVLTGPPGWLGDALPGRLVRFHHEGGTVTVAPVRPDDLTSPDDTVAGALLTDVVTGERGLGAVEFALRLLIEDRARFTAPSPPLTDVLANAGLVAAGDQLRPAAEGSGTGPPDRGGVSIAGVSNHTMGGLRRVWDAAAAHASGTAVADWAAVAHDLGDADVAGAFAEQAVGGATLDSAALGAFLDEVERQGTWSAGLAFLRSRVAEALRQTADAEEHLQAALRASPTFQPALVDSAWFASDRGNANRAATLLSAAGIGADDPEYRMVRRYSVAGPLRAGRNDPCPCGSGRKYKSCCSVRNGYPLAARVSWLHGKAVAFAQRPPQRPELFALARRVAGLDDADDDAARLVSAACDPIVVDLCLFDGGMLRRFAADRGSLLPGDERDLLDAWFERRHTMVVRGSGPDEPVRWFDVIGGDPQAEVGVGGGEGEASHALGVAVPAGDGTDVVLGTPRVVPEAHVDELGRLLRAGAEPVELAAFVGRALGGGTPSDRAPAP